uniref:Uncharacterized protein n=1 Tax=Oryza nivara TaxID=4536 RepID=A0A0E0FF28_ORYNI
MGFRPLFSAHFKSSHLLVLPSLHIFIFRLLSFPSLLLRLRLLLATPPLHPQQHHLLPSIRALSGNSRVSFKITVKRTCPTNIERL